MGLKILVTGRGSGGSWEIRGAQLGKAIGAEVAQHVNSAKGYDLAVVVKRPRYDVLERIRSRHIPIVWDVVDAWPQPDGNSWSYEKCMAWLDGQVAAVRPAALVAATQGMATDCARYKLPVLFLPHHARPGLLQNPIRERAAVVGYEGGEQYIEQWRPVIEAACAKRGMRFVVNPPDLTVVDIVLALRDQTGYAPRQWKSCVKLSNAQGSGTPCILAREAGYQEMACGVERWADTAEELELALDELMPVAVRRVAHSRLIKVAPPLASVAEGYRRWLTHLAS